MKIAEEAALRRLFPECELGAEPPIGCLFGLPTIMDDSLAKDELVVFQAGTHEDAVTMALSEFRRVAQPEVAHFGRRFC